MEYAKRTLTPFITVVVPVYNEERELPACLAALQQQDYAGGYEIVVVNNACTDRSAAIARELGARVVDEPRKGIAYAVHAGFAAARGEVIARTDADTRVPPDWLSRLARLLRRPGVVAAGGSYVFFDGPAWLRLFSHFSALFMAGLTGANLAVWRWVYERAGGFNPALRCNEDSDLGLRLRRFGRVVIDHRMVVSTSSRRFQTGLLRTLWRYSANYVGLLLFHRTLYTDFSDIRSFSPAQRRYRWVALTVITLAAVLALPVFAAVNPSAQAYGPVLARIQTTEPVVALTFDGCPDGQTAAILDILAAHQAKATFFLVGEKVERYPELAQRIVAEGHVVGNQTYGYSAFTAIRSRGDLEADLDRGSQVIESTTGIIPHLFRPPYGWRSPWMMDVLQSRGYEVVTWSFSPDDFWQLPMEGTGESIYDQVKPGDIIRINLTDMGTGDADDDSGQVVLAHALDELQARGYRFVTLPELISIQEAAPREAVGE